MSQVALRVRVEPVEGGASLDLGDVQEVCRQHPLIVSSPTDNTPVTQPAGGFVYRGRCFICGFDAGLVSGA